MKIRIVILSRIKNISDIYTSKEQQGFWHHFAAAVERITRANIPPEIAFALNPFWSKILVA